MKLRWLRRNEGGAIVLKAPCLLDKIIVRPRVRDNLAGIYMKNFRGNLTDEMNIMRNENKRSLVALQGERQ